MPRLLIFVAAAAILGCGDGRARQKGLCPDPGRGGPVALFDIFEPGGEELAPFPSDLKTVAHAGSPTGLRLSFDHSMFREGLNVLDGFGLRQVLLVPYARSIEPSSLPGSPAGSVAPGSSMFLLDIEDLGPEETGTLDSRKLPIDVGMVEDGNSLFMPTIRNALAARPVDRLEPAHTYSLVVTACVTALDGSGLGTQETFKQIRDEGRPPAGASPDGTAALESVIGYLEREGYDRGDLAMVTTFTTQAPEHDLLAIREIVDGLDPPAPAIDHVFDAVDAGGNLHPDLLDHIEDPEIDGDPGDLISEFDMSYYRFDRIDKVVYGTFDAPVFLDGDDMLARDPDTWRPRITGTERLEFLLTLPREEPSEGIGPPYDVLVYQHAMTVCKETIIALADTMARFGIAVVGIDAKQHGSRHPDEPGTCSLEFGTFMYLDNFSRSTAYFAQTVVDVLSLVRMLEEGGGIDVLPHPGGDGAADLDVARLAFAGQSMGSSMGIDIMALEPAFGAGNVNVGAGSMLNLLFSTSLDLPDDPVSPLSEFDLYEMSMGAIVPTMADKADPLNWADNLLVDPIGTVRDGPLSVLYQQAAWDEILPYESTVMTALAMRIPIVDAAPRPIEGLEAVSTPVSDNLGGVTAALFQFDARAEHQFLLLSEGPEAADVMYEGQLQLAVFLDTFFETAAPVVIDPADDAQVSAHAPLWVWPTY